MEGMQILETTTAIQADSVVSTLVSIFATGMLIGVIVALWGLIIDNAKLLLIGFFSFIIFALGIIIPTVISPREVRYKAVVTDEYAASAQFNEDFEVIEKDGMIYWLREKGSN